jgi:hypothetical protein
MPDDILICCASFEDRCLGVLKRFDREYKARNSFVFYYIEPEEISPEENIGLCAENKENLENGLRKVTEQRTILLPVERSSVIHGLQAFLKRCAEEGISLENMQISIDISGFTKQYILLLLKVLDNSNNHLRIIYTKPQKYGAHFGKPLSEGVRRILTIPFFEGHISPWKDKDFLILFLGYEGDRALSIWNEYEPSRTLAFIGKPVFHRYWEVTTIKLNQSLLISPTVEFDFISSSNPFLVRNKLEKTLEKLSYKFKKDYNYYISPLGTKLQTVGIYLFTKNGKYPSPQLVYAVPRRYFKERAVGIGETSWFLLDQDRDLR